MIEKAFARLRESRARNLPTELKAQTFISIMDCIVSYLERGFVETGEGPPRVRGLKLGRGDGPRPPAGVHVCGLVEP